jgi:site-specific recombinase XerD
MLRHACGFKLANDGHDTRALQHYLGHKNIQHTVRYTDMAPDRFKESPNCERIVSRQHLSDRMS